MLPSHQQELYAAVLSTIEQIYVLPTTDRAATTTLPIATSERPTREE